MSDKRVGERLRQAREKRGLTQAALTERLKAEGVPCNENTVYRTEKAERDIPLTEAAVWVRILGIDLWWLATGDDAHTDEWEKGRLDGIRESALRLMAACGAIPNGPE